MTAALRPVTEVVVGVVIDAVHGRYLMSSRPAGKPYAGYWEFPGGKIEAAEGAIEALTRELREELSVTVTRAVPWFTLEHDYPHAYVRLHYWRVTAFDGALKPLEGQQYEWFALGRWEEDRLMLPMNAMVVRRLSLPEVVACVTGSVSEENLKALSRAGVRGVVWAQEAHRAVAESVAQRLGVPCREIALARLSDFCRDDEAAGDAALVPASETERFLQAATHGLPLYVFGRPEELDRLQQRGAHGVAIAA